MSIGRMVRLAGRRRVSRTDRQTSRRAGRQTKGQSDWQKVSRMDRRTDGRTGWGSIGRMVRRAGRRRVSRTGRQASWMDRRTDGRAGGRSVDRSDEWARQAGIRWVGRTADRRSGRRAGRSAIGRRVRRMGGGEVDGRASAVQVEWAVGCREPSIVYNPHRTSQQPLARCVDYRIQLECLRYRRLHDPRA